jgi:hypothetical protein
MSAVPRRRGRPKKITPEDIPPEKVVEMVGSATEATLNVLSGEKAEVVVEMDRNEKEDLEEYCRHHPEVKTPGEALKKMAGLRGYRTMKQMVDPERKKPSVDLRDAGMPSNIPCALHEILEKWGMTYGEFLQVSSKLAVEFAQKAEQGDQKARDILKVMFVNLGTETAP